VLKTFSTNRRFTGRWRPAGPDEFVTVDTRQFWVGKHSPLTRLDENAPHGIQQAGFGLVHMFTAISAGEAWHEMFRYSGNFLMGAYTASTGVLSVDKVTTNISPVGLMFKLYRRHFGTIPVAITGNAPQPEVKGTVSFDKPKASSGSGRNTQHEHNVV
jgi:hypothetical protein